MRILLPFALALVALTGCGPNRRDLAESQVNQVADTWDGGDGFAVQGTDPWSEPLTAKVEKGDVNFKLTVRSNGPDRLPQTRDDLVATRHKKHTPIGEVAGKGAEPIAAGAARGMVAGLREGLSGKKADDKKDAAKK